MTKKTNVQKYAELIELAKNGEQITDELIEFLQDRMEKAIAKNGNRKPTKTQIENEVIKEKILDLMADNVHRNASEVMKEMSLDSTNKASALLNQLVADGKLVKGTENSRTVFYAE